MSDNKVTTKVKPNVLDLSYVNLGDVVFVSFNEGLHEPYLVCPVPKDFTYSNKFLINFATGRYLEINAVKKYDGYAVTHIIPCGKAHITIEEM